MMNRIATITTSRVSALLNKLVASKYCVMELVYHSDSTFTLSDNLLALIDGRDEAFLGELKAQLKANQAALVKGTSLSEDFYLKALSFNNPLLKEYAIQVYLLFENEVSNTYSEDFIKDFLSSIQQEFWLDFTSSFKRIDPLNSLSKLLLFDNVIILSVDNQTQCFLAVNDYFCQLSGYQSSELIGKNVRDFYHPEDFVASNGQYKEDALIAGVGLKLSNWAGRFICKDGSMRHFVLDGVLEHNVWLCLGRDATTEVVQKQLLERDALRLKTFTDLAFEGILIEQNETIVDANNTFAQLLGYSLDEVLNRSSRHHIYPEDLAFYDEETQVNKHKNYEIRANKKDGSLAYFEVLKREITYFNQPARLIALRDITKKKNLERQLKQANTLQHAILDTASLAIISVDNTGLISTFNKGAERMLGYSANEVIGKMSPSLFISEHCRLNEFDKLTTNFHKDFTGQHNPYLPIADEAITLRCTQINKAKKEIVVNLNVLPLIDEQSKLKYGYIGISKDITEEEQLLVELTESKTQLSKTMEMAGLGSWIYTSIDNKISLSDEVFSMLSIERVDFDFQKLKSLCDHKDWEFAKGKFAEIAFGKNINIDLRFSVYGEEKYLNISGFPVLDKDMNLRVSGIVQDITARKQQERELIKSKLIAEKATKVKDLFLANISHEIRTPLNSIIGFTGLFSDKITDLKLANYVNTINYSGKNLLHIINEVLDFTKLESGNVKLESIDFKLANSFTYIKDLLWDAAIKNNVELKSSIDKKLPEMLTGDSYRLNQILTNLVSNGVKFTKNGVVSLNATLENRDGDVVWVKFVVSDTGIGIHNSKVNKIFESFTQASIDVTRKYGGTGLGLSIVKHLVSLFNGTLKVESEVGKGSSFVVTLPFKISVKNYSSTGGGKLIEDEYASLLEGIKILVAEDHEINQLLMKEVFANYNCQVTIAKNGVEALGYLESERFDLILMDLQMPELDGYATTIAIRQSNAQYNKIPIIALTADTVRGELEKCIKVGMNDYLSKPFDFAILMEKISNQIKQSSKVAIKLVDRQYVKKAEEQLGSMYDLSYLKTVTQGQLPQMVRLIQLFLSDTPKLIMQIKQHLSEGDYHTASAILHKLKGAASLFGASDFVTEISTCEQHCKLEQNVDAGFITQRMQLIEELSIILLEKLKDEVNALFPEAVNKD